MKLNLAIALAVLLPTRFGLTFSEIPFLESWLQWSTVQLRPYETMGVAGAVDVRVGYRSGRRRQEGKPRHLDNCLFRLVPPVGPTLAPAARQTGRCGGFELARPIYPGLASGRTPYR